MAKQSFSSEQLQPFHYFWRAKQQAKSIFHHRNSKLAAAANLT